MIVLSADADAFKTIHCRTVGHSVRLFLYIEDMFTTGHDAANRAVVRQYPPDTMNVVGLALREDKKLIGKAAKHAQIHA